MARHDTMKKLRKNKKIEENKKEEYNETLKQTCA